MKLPITHQYVVSYYKNDFGYRESIIWQNILTENVERHDGAPFIAHDSNGHVSDLIYTATNFVLNEIYRLPERLTHQYVVTYSENETFQLISWRDILTDKLHHHTGPAEIAKNIPDRRISRYYYDQDELTHWEYVKPDGSVERWDTISAF